MNTFREKLALIDEIRTIKSEWRSLQDKIHSVERKRDLYICLNTPLTNAIQEYLRCEKIVECNRKEFEGTHTGQTFEEFAPNAVADMNKARGAYGTALNHYRLYQIHDLLDEGIEIDSKEAEKIIKLPEDQKKRKSDRPEDMDRIDSQTEMDSTSTQQRKIASVKNFYCFVKKNCITNHNCMVAVLWISRSSFFSKNLIYQYHVSSI